MNKKYLLLSIIPFLLPACQNLPQHTTMPQMMNTQHNHDINLKQILTDYTWSYQATQNLPAITASFDQSQNLSISTGCNQQNGSWQLTGQTLTTSLLRSTMMMCSPQLMLQEKLSAALFDQSKLTLQINHHNSNTPQLQMIDQTGKTFTFTGTIKPEAQYQSTAEIIFLDIAPTTKPCTNTTNAQCFQVKEIKYNDQGIQTYIDQNWRVLPERIQGYTHDPKVKKTIRVKRFQTKATVPQYAYIYDMTVQQEVSHHRS
ncbi:META and DUF4377 domain-containing protein [Acinetobacter sp. B10A]|uniref:META and DUF4377 domain-containing protein n=1 Tax=Acinetobacter baretiae TaxID=2605383 RepID=UPI001B3C81EC|nr:META and DUF4377 domain-containing protein [Acinetobacter baretiae]MBF7686193.1 META and DUF4377 domain-containing protein [Acinetobacter baretiae]